jgi:gliding motility-associated-like protein
MFMQAAATLALCFMIDLMVAQPLTYTLKATAEHCNKATAHLGITGEKTGDSLVVEWSTGERNVRNINQLSAGNHSVRVYLKRKQDTVYVIKDTTLAYIVEKTECEISVPKHFSPNDDGYNDRLQIGNVRYYPNFEFHVHNRWGQRVHFQKKEFEPWDGKWLGVDLPDGTYYFVFFFDGADKGKMIKGDVTILR